MKKKLSGVLIIAALSFIMLVSVTSLAFADSTELAITNNTGMFKAVTASLENESGQETLVMALSADGYHELFKGTYEQAVANGTATENWIHGNKNADSKWEFRIPLSNGESYVPLIAISDTYYQKYLKGEGTLERSFFPRQATVDRKAKTLVTDDYNEITDFTVTSNVADFKTADKASTKVVGGPNSNNYSVAPTLVMSDKTYDKVTYPTVVNGAVGTADAELADGSFVIAMTNAPNKEAFTDKTPIEMTFHVASDAAFAEAGTDVVRTVTIDKMAKTITIDGEALTPVAKKSAGISIVSKSNIKTVKAGGKKLKKNVTFTVKTKASSGAKTTYKKTTKGKITVSAAGKVTLKKGLKKGKYTVKVKVSAPATAAYKAVSKTISIKVTVK